MCLRMIHATDIGFLLRDGVGDWTWSLSWKGLRQATEATCPSQYTTQGVRTADFVAPLLPSTGSRAVADRTLAQVVGHQVGW